jgi:hypothetical protein
VVAPTARSEEAIRALIEHGGATVEREVVIR